MQRIVSFHFQDDNSAFSAYDGEKIVNRGKYRIQVSICKYVYKILIYCCFYIHISIIYVEDTQPDAYK